MGRRIIAMVAVLAIFPAVSVAQDVARQIVVSGQGRVSAQPDMAVIRIGIRREARAAADALGAAADAVASVLSELEKAGIATRDIQTATVTLTPNYRYSNDGSPPRFLGYVSGSDLTVRIRALDRLGAVLDAVATDGATSFSGPSFQVADPAPLEDDALAAAVADAARKAAVMADAAGVTLGAVVDMTEAGAAAPQPMLRGTMMEAAADSAMPVAAGEVDFRSSVAVTYAISD